MMTVLLNQQILLTTTIFAITVIPFFFLKEIYEWLGQEPEIAEQASKFVVAFLPGVYFFTIGSLFMDYSET